MMRNLLVLTLALVTTHVNAQPVFENRSEMLDLTHEYTGGWEHFVGGGVTTFDCNGDLFPEVYLAGGASSSTLLRNTTNGRGGSVGFVPDTPENLAIVGATGAYPLDIDSDGVLDLFIMRVGENLLLKGGPDCTFAEFEDLEFDAGDSWTTAFSATWENQNALPTLAIGNYVDRNDPDGPFEACDTSLLMRPDGLSYISTPLLPAYCPLSMLFSDWGHNGRQDLRVSNDRHYYVRGGTEQMWAMEDTPRLYTSDDGWTDFSIWGMGIASRDITGDGLPEVFLSSMGDQKLQMPAPDTSGPAYLDATYGRGTTAHRPYSGSDGRPSTGWHIDFGDVDNDGLDDVLIAKGNVEQMPGSAMSDPNNLLMQAADGSFYEVGDIAGINTMDRSRGAALVDLNLDGQLDIVVSNRRADVEVYQNTTVSTGNWLLIDVQQSGINPQAVGGWIEVDVGGSTKYREITIGGGHASGAATFAHFGLGNELTVQLRMIWPDGTTSQWLEINTNQILQIQRDGNRISAVLL